MGGGPYPRCFFDGPPRYGAPGVELTGLHKETATVTQLHFLPGQVRGCPGGGTWQQPLSTSHTPLSSPLHPQGWLLSLLDDNTLHLWEVCHKEGCSHLEETRSFGLPGRPGSAGAKYLPEGRSRSPAGLRPCRCQLGTARGSSRSAGAGWWPRSSPWWCFPHWDAPLISAEMLSAGTALGFYGAGRARG